MVVISCKASSAALAFHMFAAPSVYIDELKFRKEIYCGCMITSPYQWLYQRPWSNLHPSHAQ